MKVGILGGTFDPIHVAHLWMAEAARDALGLDRVWLVPASRPPHKPDREGASYDDRVAMVRLAVEGAPGLDVSEIERDDSQPSYTAETLRRFRVALPRAAFWLILGADSLRDLPEWREPDEILRLARLAVLPRPGTDWPASPPGADVFRLPGPLLDVSSTELRARLRAGRSVRYLVPESARRWIERRGLYRDAPTRGADG